MMEVMFERMNTIIKGHGKMADKENTPPPSFNAGSGSSGGMKTNSKKCSHCRKYVFHKPANCYELKANTSKHWTGWTSVKDTGEASAWQGLGTMSKDRFLVADNLVQTPVIKNSNYWSPLFCLVEEQEDDKCHLDTHIEAYSQKQSSRKWKQKKSN